MKHFLVAVAAACAFAAQAQSTLSYANHFDQALAGSFEARERDWRNGAVSYQVLVDRFAPSDHLDAKRALYPPPKVLRRWDELPLAGPYLPDAKVTSHEIDFWGGDLQSLAGRLDYVQQMGVNVLYLNPIALAWTNHKYDTLDYKQVSPEFGTRDDVRQLAANLHRRGMKLVLDGVFNHMGRNAPIFQQALADPSSRWRDWFVFGPQFPGGARGWANVQNLPELNLENPQVRAYLWGDPDSVVRGWLRDGVDGWRLAAGRGLRHRIPLPHRADTSRTRREARLAGRRRDRQLPARMVPLGRRRAELHPAPHPARCRVGTHRGAHGRPHDHPNDRRRGP